MPHLETDPNLRENTHLECFTLPSSSLVETDELRLDARYFNPAVIAATKKIEQSGMQAVHLRSVVFRIFIPTRFKRVYVEQDEGVPFLQGSDVVRFQPTDLKYLSREAHNNMDELTINAGWILITRSGTVGRATLCPNEWDGWAASEHIFRVVPNEEKCPAGYLFSFLASPFGQVQLSAQLFGGVVDELTEEHVGNVLVPLPATDEDMEIMNHVNDTMKESILTKSHAVNLMNRAVQRVSDRLSE